MAEDEPSPHDDGDGPTARFDPDNFPTRAGLTVGRRMFDRYTLETQAGRGGMGVVWRVHDEKLERTVALKFLPPEVAADAEAVRDLKRETKRCLDLTHPHIVRVHDFVEENGMAAIAMEFVAGESLAKRKATAPAGCLSVTELAPLVRQLCTALDYAHLQARIVHRDLKPANLLVTADGQLKVTDFGIARSLSETATRLTGRASGDTSGTLPYMSPQQLAGDKPTAADDIYALGATLYDLLTGKPPFHRGDAFSLMKQIAERTPLPLAAQRAELEITHDAIPENWEETILACLAKDPAQRPKSAGEVAVRLGLSAGPAGIPLHGAGRPPDDQPARRSRETDTRPDKSRRLLWVALAAAILALAGAGYYFGVYAPEQKRLAVAAQQAAAEAKAYEEVAGQIASLVDGAPAARRDTTATVVQSYLATAPARYRVEAEKLWAQRLTGWEAAARAALKAEGEQKDYAAIAARIDALIDGATPAQRAATEVAVKAYLATAPLPHREAAEQRWTQRLAGWEAARLAAARGGIIVRTEPAGADVTVGALEHGSSPLTIKGVKLGKYPVKARLAGYEDWNGEVEVFENEFSDLSAVLVRSTGTLLVASEPAGVEAEIKGDEKTWKVKTPQTVKLPTGNYEIAFVRAGWGDVRQKATVTRGGAETVRAELRGGAIDVETEPTGANVLLQGRPAGNTPLTLRDVPWGTPVKVTVELPAYAPVTRELAPKPGQTLPLHLQLQRLRTRLKLTELPGGSVDSIQVRWAGQTIPVAADGTIELPESGGTGRLSVRYGAKLWEKELTVGAGEMVEVKPDLVLRFDISRAPRVTRLKVDSVLSGNVSMTSSETVEIAWLRQGNGRWLECESSVIATTNSSWIVGNEIYERGTRYRFRRSGSAWSTETVSGGLKAMKSYKPPAPYSAAVWLTEGFLPPQPVLPGESWDVPLADSLMTGFAMLKNPTGSIRGRLVDVQMENEQPVAVLAYELNLQGQAVMVSASQSIRGTVEVRAVPGAGRVDQVKAHYSISTQGIGDCFTEVNIAEEPVP
jgi:hypothetical protein